MPRQSHENISCLQPSPQNEKNRLLIVNINKLKDWFRERGYPEEIVNKETKRALESSIGSSNNKSKKITQGERQNETLLAVTLFYVI